MIAGLLLVATIALLAVMLGVLISGWSGGTDTEEWARTNGVTLGPATEPVVDDYLRNRRGLRRVGALAGLVIPPAFTAATTIDLRVTGWVWLFLGYLVGQVVAELSLARVPGSSTRVASLRPRRLVDYLPRPLAVAQVVLPVICGAVAIAVMVVAPSATPIPSFDPGGADPLAAALVAGPAAVVLALVTVLGERRLVRRPQPMVDPDLVTLDDAMRSSSVRTVAATNVAIAAVLLTTQLTALAYHAEAGPVQGALWTAAIVALIFAFVSWQRWVNRGWRVPRPGSDVAAGAPA